MLSEQIHELVLERNELHRSQYKGEITNRVFDNRIKKNEELIKPLLRQKANLMIKVQNIKDKALEKKQQTMVEEVKEFNRQRRELKKVQEKTILKQTTKPIIKTKHITTQPINKQPSNTLKQTTKPITYKSLIIKALKHDKIDSEEKLLYVVLHKKPGKDKETLRRQVRNIISMIKKSDRYVFDNKKYKVSKVGDN